MFITANWTAPANIKAVSTTRMGGFSQAPYDQFNLAEQVGDDPVIVQKNRELLKKSLALSDDPIWIEQIHSHIALPAESENRNIQADATYTNKPNQVCIVTTADCLPILLACEKGTYVAAIHAGWRGLASGIIDQTLAKLPIPATQLLAWLGPAISQKKYEIGNEVRDIFLALDPQYETAFCPANQKEKWLADLYQIARLQLNKNGVTKIFGGDYCTYSDATLFYSYRRDGKNTGRMASLIWMSY